MKFAIFVFVALFAVAFARPESVILKSESVVEPESYKYAYETSDGTRHEESGDLRDVGSDHESINVHGSFSFVADDGKTYTVTYTADEHGFQPHGEHLPELPKLAL